MGTRHGDGRKQDGKISEKDVYGNEGSRRADDCFRRRRGDLPGGRRTGCGAGDVLAGLGDESKTYKPDNDTAALAAVVGLGGSEPGREAERRLGDEAVGSGDVVCVSVLVVSDRALFCICLWGGAQAGWRFAAVE